MQEPSFPVTSNNTELSKKVEAELFGDYDTMVPGPAASVSEPKGEVAGKGANQERTGRPLGVNLDLLSFQAKRKSIKVPPWLHFDITGSRVVVVVVVVSVVILGSIIVVINSCSI